MKRFYITSIIVAALAGMPDAAWAEDCEWATIVYAGTSNRVWQRPNHWSELRIPNANDKVCIPHDKMVIIAVGICVGGSREWQDCDPDGYMGCPGGTCNTSISKDVVAKVIGIEGGAVLDYNLHLNPRTTLTLYGDDDPVPVHSFVDGHVEMFCGAELMIAADLTIEGSAAISGKEVGDGLFCSTWSLPPPLIRSATGTNYTLTLGGTVVLDEEMVIDVSLDNNAYVIANRGELTLQGGQKSGSGYWAIGETGGSNGVLIVDTEVEGNGTWVLDVGGTIQINHECSDLTGDVEISQGTLEVNQDFDTSGNLDMTGGTIIVTTGKTALFD